MQSDDMPKIPQAARMTAFHAGADARGDAALLAAINSGSPVPTTPEQAREVTRMELPRPDYAGLQQWFRQLAKAVAK